LPNPPYVIPSSICQSDNLSARADSEATIFQQMIDSAMLRGWPAY
jgi:hypothetical protein